MKCWHDCLHSFPRVDQGLLSLFLPTLQEIYPYLKEVHCLLLHFPDFYSVYLMCVWQCVWWVYVCWSCMPARKTKQNKKTLAACAKEHWNNTEEIDIASNKIWIYIQQWTFCAVDVLDRLSEGTHLTLFTAWIYLAQRLLCSSTFIKRSIWPAMWFPSDQALDRTVILKYSHPCVSPSCGFSGGLC